jgi:hypothetical protein
MCALWFVLDESHKQSASTKKAAFTRALPNEYRFMHMYMIRSDGWKYWTEHRSL